MNHWTRLNRVYQSPADAGGGGGSGAATGGDGAQGQPAAGAAATGGEGAATPAAGQAGQSTSESLLQQGAGSAGTDYLPEKFRVAKEDGSIDVDASARKLAASYVELEKTRPRGTTPKTPEEYKIDGLPEGVDFEAVKKDPLFTGFLKGAHARGMTNDDVSYALGEYFKLAPELLKANQQMGAEEAKAALAKVWTGGDQVVTQNLGLAMRAVKGFGTEGDVPGGIERLTAKYGNDPDFLAFAAKVGKEMQEDQPIRDGTPAAQDWDGQVAAIKAHPAYTNADHPEHKILVQKMKTLYDARYGKAKQHLGTVAA